MKKIYVASPYAGDIEKNTEFAKDACRFVLEQGHAFFCPHLLYPNILDEHNPQERQLGLDMGIASGAYDKTTKVKKFRIL